LSLRVAGFTAALNEGWHIRRLEFNWQLRARSEAREQ
jgi:hypothetical protein